MASKTKIQSTHQSMCHGIWHNSLGFQNPEEKLCLWNDLLRIRREYVILLRCSPFQHGLKK
jgi:hypothetical protein